MKIIFKSLLLTLLFYATTHRAFAWNTNLIDSFESTNGIVIGIDKYTEAQIADDYFNSGNKKLKLSFGTNNFEKVKNFYIPALKFKPKKNQSLIFDVYAKSPRDIILFYKTYFNSNKFVNANVKLIKNKKTTVEIPFALARSAFETISKYQFTITDSTEKVNLYFDNLRIEKSSYQPFKKISYFELTSSNSRTDTFFFSRGVMTPIFKNTFPFAFEKLEKINLFGAKGEIINYPLSFILANPVSKITLEVSDFFSLISNKLNAVISVGTVEYLDKRLSVDSDFYISEMPMYIKTGNSFTNVPTNSVRTFWININIPKTTNPDLYNSEIIVKYIIAGTTNQNIIPVKLDVLPFEISAKFKTNAVLSCDVTAAKPEVDRFALGFFNDTNGVIKMLPENINGDSLDDFDAAAGDSVIAYAENKISVAAYAAYCGRVDREYLTILKKLINKNPKSTQSIAAKNNINYLLNSLKTTPPLDIASKWTALLTKEQARLTGKKFDTNAIAFVVGEQKLPNGWSMKDYDRARAMLAKNIIAILNSNENNKVFTTAFPRITFEASIEIPLVKKNLRKKKNKTIYSVRELLFKPVIDGKIDKNERQRALKIKQFTRITGEKSVLEQTEAMLGWYESNFYIFVACENENTNQSVEIYIKPEDKNWKKYSVNQNGKMIISKSDGKISRSTVKFVTLNTNGKTQFEFEIPLTNCLTHSGEFGLNICCRDNKNFFAWKFFKNNKIKFANIKLEGAEEIVRSLTKPLEPPPLKIVGCDILAFADSDVITPEIIWEGERVFLKKSKLKFTVTDTNGKQYSAITSSAVYPRQIVYLKLNNFLPGRYKFTVNLIDSGGKSIATFNSIIQILQHLL